jgi:hypothetical protein
MPGCGGSGTDKELEGNVYAFMLSDPVGRFAGLRIRMTWRKK